MKCLFAHDHRFMQSGDSVYTEAQFSASTWERFLEHFESLLVVSRSGSLPAGKKVDDLQLSSRERVAFALMPNLSTVRGQLWGRKAARAHMEALVASSDAVIATVPTQIGLMAVECARTQGKPYAILVTGCAWDGLWNYGGWRAKAYAPVMFTRVRRAVRRAPFVYYVTREFLQGRYPSANAITIACSDVDIEEPDAGTWAKRCERLQGRQGPIVFGLIGSLQSRIKGIHVVLQALRQRRDALGPVELRILGNGDPAPWQAMAKELGLERAVRFDGTLPAGEPIMRWLDETDVYLQPSFKEGLPRALVEAMSRGCPAIASRCGGIPELLPADVLTKPGDAERLGELLVRAVNDRQWLEQQAMRNWERAREYARPRLERRRSEFWFRFARYVKSEGSATEVSA